MIVNYEDKKIETGDAFQNLEGGIYDYVVACGTDEEGTDCVVIWQKHYGQLPVTKVAGLSCASQD